VATGGQLTWLVVFFSNVHYRIISHCTADCWKEKADSNLRRVDAPATLATTRPLTWYTLPLWVRYV